MHKPFNQELIDYFDEASKNNYSWWMIERDLDAMLNRHDDDVVQDARDDILEEVIDYIEDAQGSLDDALDFVERRIRRY